MKQCLVDAANDTSEHLKKAPCCMSHWKYWYLWCIHAIAKASSYKACCFVALWNTEHCNKTAVWMHKAAGQQNESPLIKTLCSETARQHFIHTKCHRCQNNSGRFLRVKYSEQCLANIFSWGYRDLRSCKMSNLPHGFARLKFDTGILFFERNDTSLTHTNTHENAMPLGIRTHEHGHRCTLGCPSIFCS